MSRHVPVIEGEPLPEVLARVAEACGVGAALNLAGTFGGRELYVPRPESVDEDHPLAVALGLACARKAAAVLGHGKLLIPLGPASSVHRRTALYRRLRREGRSNSQIAAALGIHVRAVEFRNQRARRIDDEAEPDFFD